MAETISPSIPVLKTKLPSIMIGRDFYSKPRNKKWIKEHGSDAIIILQCVWIASSQERDCKIPKDDILEVPFPIHFEDEKVMKVIESAVVVGLLDFDGAFYFNSQIVSDYNNYKHKQENYRKGREKTIQAKVVKSNTCEDSPRILQESSEDCVRMYMNMNMNNELLGSKDLKDLSACEGRKQLAEHVWLSEMDIDNATMEFGRHRLNKADLDRAILHLDKHLSLPENASKRPYAYKHLVTWALKEAMNERTMRINMANAESRKKPEEARRPVTMSPPAQKQEEPQKPLSEAEKAQVREKIRKITSRRAF
jgi:hypothetical protein